MKKTAKALLILLTLTFLIPLKHWAQTPYRQYAPDGILLNFHEIDDIYFRAFLLYDLSFDDRFVLIPEETYGQFYLTAKDDNIRFTEEFERFYADAETDFSLLSKTEVTDQMSVWKSSVEATDYLSIMMDVNTASLRSDNDHCLSSMPFCTSEVIEFAAAYQGGATGEPGPNYGCLLSQPYPSWYHMRIQTAGQFIIHMEAHDASGNGHDIDYCIWGPFTDPYAPCVSGLTCDKLVDCSYSTASVENVYLGYPISQHNHGSTSLVDGSCVNTNNNPPHVPQVGEYYILMITNFSQYQQTISFTKMLNSGPGETDCGILPGVVNNDGPYCVGETINLTVNQQDGATYSWTGPNGFTSSQLNPSRPNCTMAMAGEYTCTTSIGAQTTSASTMVEVFAQPTANFSANTVCLGSPTEFVNLSTTNPSGQAITGYSWDFGDGGTSTDANPTHTYTQVGTYHVTLSVSTGGGHCTSDYSLNVTVDPAPVANFEANTVCQGGATQLTSTSTGTGINSYQWNFGDNQTGSGQSTSHTYAQPGSYQVTLTIQTANGCQDQYTQTVTVNPLPSASFNALPVCQGEAMQFTSTSTGQGINSYQWNFDDGQTSSGQNTSHVFAQAGPHQVTLTVQTQQGCTNSITQTVEVYAMPSPTATATPSTVIYGGSATLTGSAGAQGTFDFHWEPANMVVNSDSQTTQTVALQQSQTYTLTVTNPQGGCTSTTQITVSLEGSSLTASASADHYDLCEGASTVLHALPSGGDASHYSFSWTPANTLDNPTSQNPTATPQQVGSNTYTCHISDSFTSIDVPVTIQVHPIEEEHQYETICANDTYIFFGDELNVPNTYEHHELTQYGCEKTIYLHLDNWPTYDETTITEYICHGETYEFYGTPYTQSTQPSQTFYVDHTTAHGCDSIVRLNLTVYPENPIQLDPRPICTGQTLTWFDGNVYSEDGAEAYYDSIDNHGCLQVYKLELIVGDYQTPPNYNPNKYECVPYDGEPYYYWDIADREYVQDATDTFVVDGPPGECAYLYTLNLKFHREFYNESSITACNEYYWPVSNLPYYETQTIEWHSSHSFGDVQCDSTYILHLEINNFQQKEVTVDACDNYEWDPEGKPFTTNDWYAPSDNNYTFQGTFKRTYEDINGCDSIVTLYLGMDYTPRPTDIYPVDNSNTAPHWVVTATEFQINTYDFNILYDSLHPAEIYWDSVSWKFEDPSVQWLLEPNRTTTPPGMECKLYVLNHINDTVWIEARAYSGCETEGIPRRYWFVSSFYGTDDQTDIPSDFFVVPNPNKGQMTLYFDRFGGDINIKVYDMRGALIDQFETSSSLESSTYTYQMRNREAGIYFIVATGKEGTIAKKVIIQR